MRRTAWRQELRMTRFEEAFFGWTENRLNQDEAARVLGVYARTFRRWSDRYEEEGLDGLRDKRPPGRNLIYRPSRSRRPRGKARSISRMPFAAINH